VLYLLIVFALFALLVCPAVSLPMVVTAGTVATVAPCRSVRPDCDVAARSAEDTARRGRAENSNRDGRAEGAGCAGGGAVTATRVAATVADSRAAGVVGSQGAGPLTVTRKP